MFKLTHFARIRISNNVGSSGYQKMFNNPFCRRVKITCLQQQYRELNTDKWMYRLQARSSCRVKPINGILHVVHLSRVVQRPGTEHVLTSSSEYIYGPMLVFLCTMSNCPYKLAKYCPLGLFFKLWLLHFYPIMTLFIWLLCQIKQEAEKLRLPECGGECDGCCWCDNSCVGSLYWEQSPGRHAPQN